MCLTQPHFPGGHAGYEIAPFIPSLEGLVVGLVRWASGADGRAALNTVQHHDWHHRYPSKHFSLYFTVWDRWQGTLHDEYDGAVAATEAMLHAQ